MRYTGKKFHKYFEKYGLLIEIYNDNEFRQLIIHYKKKQVLFYHENKKDGTKKFY